MPSRRERRGDEQRPAAGRAAPRPRLSGKAIAALQAEERGPVLARHPVSRETAERLERFVALLGEWQAHINLVSPSSLPHVWTRHVEDGLLLGELARDARRWADLGSGAGFPGLVLACRLAEQPGAHVDLVEANSKKAAFLRAVVRDLTLPATVHAERIEASGSLLAKADAVTARALAPLTGLLALVEPHLGPGARAWFAKGRSHEQEIADAAAVYEFDMVKHALNGEEGSVILEISGLRRRELP